MLLIHQIANSLFRKDIGDNMAENVSIEGVSSMFPDVSVELGEDVYYKSTNGFGSVYAAKVVNVKGTDNNLNGVGADILIFNDVFPYVHFVSNVIVGDKEGNIQKKS